MDFRLNLSSGSQERGALAATWALEAKDLRWLRSMTEKNANNYGGQSFRDRLATSGVLILRQDFQDEQDYAKVLLKALTQNPVNLFNPVNPVQTLKLPVHGSRGLGLRDSLFRSAATLRAEHAYPRVNPRAIRSVQFLTGASAAQLASQAAQSPLHVAQSPVQSAQVPLRPAQMPVQSTQVALQAAQMPVHAAQVTLQSAHMTLQPAQVALQSTQMTLHLAQVPLQIAETGMV